MPHYVSLLLTKEGGWLAGLACIFQVKGYSSAVHC